MHLYFGGKRNRHSISLSRLRQLQIHWHVLITKTNQGISILYTASTQHNATNVYYYVVP